MTTLRIATPKIQNLDDVIPGLAKVWRQVKAETGTKKRCPRSVTLTDQAAPMYPNDNSCCARFPLDLVNMKLGAQVHVSAGEWAVHAGQNPDGAIDAVPNGAAIISCEWNDYYGTFSLTIQVAPGALPAQLKV